MDEIDTLLVVALTETQLGLEQQRVGIVFVELQGAVQVVKGGTRVGKGHLLLRLQEEQMVHLLLLHRKNLVQTVRLVGDAVELRACLVIVCLQAIDKMRQRGGPETVHFLSDILQKIIMQGDNLRVLSIELV